MELLKRIFILLTILSTTNSFSKAQNPILEDFLKEFHQNPRKVFQQIPYRDGNDFIARHNLNREEKLIWRREHFNDSAINKSGFQHNDYVNGLFESPESLIINAYEIDEKKLRVGKVKYAPWTGYYWSTSNGLIANRFNDRRFKNKWTFKGKYKYSKKRTPSYYIKKGKIEKLSPAEKYELLIGDKKQAFSQQVWQDGLDEIEKYGRIRNWAGLCDGLALAPAALPWPKYAIKIKSFDGKHTIKFYPEDIKALGIWLWSRAYIPSRKIGGRCESYNPKTDSIGRIIDQDCQDTNPGTFHLAVTNRIGIKKDILIMDNSYDKSVWNFSIIAYKFSYFNPKTSKTMNKITDAMIPIESYQNDKFKKYRSPQAKYIVGVDARIKYLNFRDPVAKNKDSNTKLPLVNDYYRYDLELNAQGDIIGGEWYARAHPDFLWVPFENTDPMAPFDFLNNGTWDAKKELLPAQWAQNAILSAESGEISAPIVKALFKLSNEGIEGIVPR